MLWLAWGRFAAYAECRAHLFHLLLRDLHWVEDDSGVPMLSCGRSCRLKGAPLSYFSRAIMLAAVASYFCIP